MKEILGNGPFLVKVALLAIVHTQLKERLLPTLEICSFKVNYSIQTNIMKKRLEMALLTKTTFLSVLEAQLFEQLLPTPEICSSIRVIGIFSTVNFCIKSLCIFLPISPSRRQEKRLQ